MATITELTDLERAELERELTWIRDEHPEAAVIRADIEARFLKRVAAWRMIDREAPPGCGRAFFEWFGRVTTACWEGRPPRWLVGSAWLRADAQPSAMRWGTPLSAREIEALEQRVGFALPADYRAFLETLHTARGAEGMNLFVDWRTAEIRDFRFNDLSGLLGHVWTGGVWLDTWGPFPRSIEEAAERLRELLSHSAALVPLSGLRSLIAAPATEGNPVLSFHGIDTIVLGRNLREYLIHEVLVDWEYRAPFSWRSHPEAVAAFPFWGELVEFWYSAPPERVSSRFSHAEERLRAAQFERWSDPQRTASLEPQPVPPTTSHDPARAH